MICESGIQFTVPQTKVVFKHAPALATSSRPVCKLPVVFWHATAIYRPSLEWQPFSKPASSVYVLSFLLYHQVYVQNLFVVHKSFSAPEWESFFFQLILLKITKIPPAIILDRLFNHTRQSIRCSIPSLIQSSSFLFNIYNNNTYISLLPLLTISILLKSTSASNTLKLSIDAPHWIPHF